MRSTWFFVALLSASAARALTLETNSVVTITDIKPGATIILVGASRSSGPGDSIAIRSYREVLTDTDRDAIITYRPMNLPHRSIWVGVDAATGAYALSAPDGFPINVRKLSRTALKREDDLDILEEERWRVQLLLVRPGKGAWTLAANKRGSNDRDRHGSHLRIALSAAIALTDEHEHAPKTVKTDDVIVGIDPGRLDLFVLRIEQ